MGKKYPPGGRRWARNTLLAPQGDTKSEDGQVAFLIKGISADGSEEITTIPFDSSDKGAESASSSAPQPKFALKSSDEGAEIASSSTPRREIALGIRRFLDTGTLPWGGTLPWERTLPWGGVMVAALSAELHRIEGSTAGQAPPPADWGLGFRLVYFVFEDGTSRPEIIEWRAADGFWWLLERLRAVSKRLGGAGGKVLLLDDLALQPFGTPLRLVELNMDNIHEAVKAGRLDHGQSVFLPRSGGPAAAASAAGSASAAHATGAAGAAGAAGGTGAAGAVGGAGAAGPPPTSGTRPQRLLWADLRDMPLADVLACLDVDPWIEDSLANAADAGTLRMEDIITTLAHHVQSRRGDAEETLQHANTRQCDACFRRFLPVHPHRCPCGNARYCGERCQFAHWETHKMSCPFRRVHCHRCQLAHWGSLTRAR